MSDEKLEQNQCVRVAGTHSLDHVVILSERQLVRVLWEYVEDYFNTARPHQGTARRRL